MNNPLNPSKNPPAADVVRQQSDRPLVWAGVVSFLVYGALAAAGWVLYYTRAAGTTWAQACLWGGILCSAAAAASLIGLWLGRIGRSRAGAWVILVTLLVLGIAPTLLFESAGMVTGATGFVAAVLLANLLLAQKEMVYVLSAGFACLALAYLLDLFYPVNRPAMLPADAAFLLGGLLVFVLISLVITRYRVLSFRAKVVVAFLLIGVLSVFSVTSIVVSLSSQAALQIARQALSSAAAQAGGAVDGFMLRALERVELDAQQPLVSAFLAEPSSRPALKAEIAALLQRQRENAANRLQAAGLAGDFVDAYFLLDTQGKVVAATDESLVGLLYSQEDYFQAAINQPGAYSSPVIIQGAGGWLIFSVGIRSADDASQVFKPEGVLVARYNARVLGALLVQNVDRVGPQSYPRLVDEDGLILASGRASDPLYRAMVADPLYLESTSSLERNSWKMIYAQAQSTILQPVNQMTRSVQLVALLLAAAAAGIALFVSESITRPVNLLNQAAKQAALGDLNAKVEVRAGDELGDLAQAFNQLTDHVLQVQTETEGRVESRTRDIERRLGQLQAAAEIGRFAANIRDLDGLVKKMAQLISDRFDFYHVGIFLIDEGGKFAVLKAANSEGGQRMLAREHRLAVGQQGIVGFVASKGRPRIALDVGADAAFALNPDLPKTRSEMALPLVRTESSGLPGQVIGVLDIQSTQANAFGTEDLAVMQLMADLLAGAIENARLFVENQNSLETLRRAYGSLSREAWLDRLRQPLSTDRAPGAAGYRSLEYGTIPLAAPVEGRGDAQAEPEKGTPLSIPILVRDVVVGYVDTRKPASGETWSQEERDTIAGLVDQLGVALESARLYEASQIQAEKERLVAELTARMQENLDVDAVLRTAVTEIRQTLNLQNVTIILNEAQ